MLPELCVMKDIVVIHDLPDVVQPSQQTVVHDVKQLTGRKSDHSAERDKTVDRRLGLRLGGEQRMMDVFRMPKVETAGQQMAPAGESFAKQSTSVNKFGQNKRLRLEEVRRLCFPSFEQLGMVTHLQDEMKM